MDHRKELIVNLLKYASSSREGSSSRDDMYKEFIHVTNSKSFATILQTEAIKSPMDLLRDDHRAPEGGELIKGGLKDAHTKGSTSFTTINNPSWPLHLLLEKYAKKKSWFAENPMHWESAGWANTDAKTLRVHLALVVSYLTEPQHFVGEHLNGFMILLVRHARDIGQELFEKYKTKALQSLEQTIRFLYFMLCVGRVHVTKNSEYIILEKEDRDPMTYVERMNDAHTSEYFKRMFKSRSYTPAHFDDLKTILGPKFVVDESGVSSFKETRTVKAVNAHQLLTQGVPSYERYDDVGMVEKLEELLHILRAIEFPENDSFLQRVKSRLISLFEHDFPIVLFYTGKDLFYIGHGEWRPNSSSMRIGSDIQRVGVYEKDLERVQTLLSQYPKFRLEVVVIDALVDQGKHLDRRERFNHMPDEAYLYERFPDRTKRALKRQRLG